MATELDIQTRKQHLMIKMRVAITYNRWDVLVGYRKELNELFYKETYSTGERRSDSGVNASKNEKNGKNDNYRQSSYSRS